MKLIHLPAVPILFFISFVKVIFLSQKKMSKNTKNLFNPFLVEPYSTKDG